MRVTDTAVALFRTDPDVIAFAVGKSERDGEMDECSCGGCDLPKIRAERYERALAIMMVRDELGLWSKALARAEAMERAKERF